MTYPLIRYPLDPTGHNPNNLVIGEIHSLSSAQVRTLAPAYGPFYDESLIVYDHRNNILLTKDLDYKTVHLLQDASLTFGKSISQIILITNRAVSGDVRINYQVLGGNYQNSSKAIADAYDTFVSDTRPVDWVNGVLNKPTQFPPSLHKHLLEDVVGFGSIAVALERVAHAVTLSNIPAFQNLVDYVTELTRDFATNEDVINMSPNNKVVSMNVLINALSKYNFNSITFRPNKRKFLLGDTIAFNISCTNFAHGENLFWSVEHDNGTELPTDDEMFGAMNGLLPVLNQIGSFIIPTRRFKSKKYGDRTFRVKLKRNSINGPVVADSGVITLVNLDPNNNNNPLSLSLGMWEHVRCLSRPDVIPTAEGLYLFKLDRVQRFF